ncbi:MAG: ABC transporter ATP-binding protein [Candidatus Hydrogenedentes bacterium]|nr:ABC transporter ATP-binding protein [Candidatus Hydrogenedentota bacterium]
MESVVVIKGVSRKYRRVLALDDVSLTIPRGGVVGLVGENGAGKTTLIKHVMGLLRAQAGSVEVFGMNPVKRPHETLSRIGYLSEHRDMPGWMRIDELLRYTRALYPRWDPAYAQRLLEMFALDPSAKIRTLSMGQTAKAGLLTALAHRPELLVLDEPSSGLDPIVRRDILGAVLREVANEGRTALFSSHLLHEVETISDRVVMISAGKIILDNPLADVLSSHQRLVLVARNGQSPLGALSSALSAEGVANRWTVICQGDLAAARAEAIQKGFEVAESGPAILDDIFVARAGKRLSGTGE